MAVRVFTGSWVCFLVFWVKEGFPSWSGESIFGTRGIFRTAYAEKDLGGHPNIETNVCVLCKCGPPCKMGICGSTAWLTLLASVTKVHKFSLGSEKWATIPATPMAKDYVQFGASTPHEANHMLNVENNTKAPSIRRSACFCECNLVKKYQDSRKTLKVFEKNNVAISPPMQ